ncbi:chaperonin 10-like protein [Fomitopsis betulina]|nr:chaperonin 10-like protein [Fomitopsis betulina]
MMLAGPSGTHPRPETSQLARIITINMPEQKALYLTERFGAFAVGNAPIYAPGPGKLLIKVESAGLNTADWSIQAYGILIKEYPTILGMDVAGTVAKVGEGVTTFKEGDRVFVPGHLGRSDHAGFQQYMLTDEYSAAKIPEGRSFDEAATLPVAICVSAVALYHDGVDVIGGTCGLTPPWEAGGRGKYNDRPVVVFSGASTIGQAAIQFLRLSGFSPLITTSSLHNADYLKQLGATHVLDRKLSPQEISTEIRKITSEPITTIFDAAGIPETQNLGYDLLASGGAIAVVLPEAVDPQKKVEDKTAFFMHADVTMPQNRKLGTSLFSALPGLLESGDLKPNRFEVVPNGLEGIMAGLETLKKGVSCVKLIVHPQEGL